jgi:metallo-beta-lactamase class B
MFRIPFCFLLFLCVWFPAAGGDPASDSAAPKGVHYAPPRASWNKPVAPFRIIGNIFYVGSSGMSSFLVKTSCGDILIDGGVPQTAPLILQSLRSLGINPREVKLLVGQHSHFDHVGSFSALKEATGA